MIALAALLAFAQQGPLPSYPEALRCAALTTAQMERVSGPAWDKAWDQAVFWGLALAERAKKDGMTAAQTKAASEAATAQALAQLNAGDAAVAGEHEACAKRVPVR